MKIRYLHLSDNLYPLVTGGTELFIEQLINEQIKLKDNYEVMWACHQSSELDPNICRSLEDYKILLDPVEHSERLDRFSFVSKKVPGFYELLKNFKPDIVHFHSLGSRTNLNHFELIQKFGSKVIFTLHTPPCSCMGNMLYASHDVCDGVLNESRCTFIRLRDEAKIPFFIAKLISLLNGWNFSPNSKNFFIKLITSRKLTGKKHSSWLKMMHGVDSIHVLSEWGKDMLIRQRIDPKKIKLIKTAGSNKFELKKKIPMKDGKLKLVFWGRCSPQKGIHLIINALMMLEKELPIKLDIYGPYWENNAYSRRLRNNIKNDRRIKICGNLPQKKLLKKLQNYDLAVIPSIWMETGPLTVLEAFAAGIPVAGTDLGGIRELLSNVKGCFTLPPESKAWKQLFLKLLLNKKLLEDFIPPKHRSFSDLEKDLRVIILDLLKN